MIYEYDKNGIGGWLGLLMGFMVIRGFNTVKDLVTSFDGLFTIPSNFFVVLYMTELALVMCVAGALYLLIDRDWRFRQVFVGSIVCEWLSVLFAFLLYNEYSLEFPYTWAHIIGSLILYPAIWIPYVYRSKRLKNRLDILDVVAEVVEYKR
jgi:hypothetical protein